MNIHDIATKGDLIEFEKRLEGRVASKHDLAELEKRMDTKLDGLEIRMDVKIDYMCRKVVDEITEVISDLMIASP